MIGCITALMERCGWMMRTADISISSPRKWQLEMRRVTDRKAWGMNNGVCVHRLNFHKSLILFECLFRRTHHYVWGTALSICGTTEMCIWWVVKLPEGWNALDWWHVSHRDERWCILSHVELMDRWGWEQAASPSPWNLSSSHHS